jgi:hypothetical protein
VACGVGPPQDRVDARHQLVRRERLDDVVVGAEPQPDDAVGLLAARGQQDDRKARARPALVERPQPPHHLQPVEAGEHQVEDHEVRPAVARQLERVRPVGGDARLVAGALEVAREHLGDRRLVVDDEQRPALVAIGLHPPIVRGRGPDDKARRAEFIDV